MRKYLLVIISMICIQSAYAIIIDPEPVTGNGTVTNGPNIPPPPCTNAAVASNTCQQSPMLCDLNGFCGNTSATYTSNSWAELTNTFVGSIENNSFVTIVAGGPTISFNLWVYNCQFGDGIQLMVFSATNCGGPVINRLTWDPGMVPNVSQIVTINGLTAGESYHIMIDGFAGDVCDYAITTNEASNILVPPSITSNTTTICLGESVTLTATGGNNIYNWVSENGIPPNTNGATITFTPPTAGTFTYRTQSSAGNTNCLEEGIGEITIVVEECACTIVASASNTSFCVDDLASFNLSATLDVDGIISWQGPNGFTAVGANANNVTPPTTPGTYNYVATGLFQGDECTSTITINVHENPTGAFTNIPVINCNNAAPTLQFDGPATSTYNWQYNNTTVGTTNTINVSEPGVYTLTLTSPEDCVSIFEQTITSNLDPPILTTQEPDVLNCINTNVQITTTPDVQTVTYAWTGAQIIGASNGNSINVGEPGPYNLTVTNTDNGCTSTEIIEVIRDISIPIIEGQNVVALNCYNESATLALTLQPANSVTTWEGPNGYTANLPTIIVETGGLYTATATHPITGCTATFITMVTTDRVMPISQFSANTVLECTPYTTILTANSNIQTNTYTWFVDGNQLQAQGPVVTHTITENSCKNVELIVQNTINGCISTTTLANYLCGLTVPTAIITAQPPYLMIYDDPNVLFTSSSLNATSHYWILPNNTQDQSPSLTYNFNNIEEGLTFTLVANNGSRCFDTTTYFLAIHDDVLFYVPNTFTPDGDSRNNDFRVSLTGGFDPYSFNMYIFNRWGEMIWENHDHTRGWDGTYNGKLVPDGIYSYSIDFKRSLNDEKRQFRGGVTIIR